MDTNAKSDGITAKRCLVAGIWACVVIAVTSGIEPEGLALWVVMIPLTGLPWLFFSLHDRHTEGRTIGAGESIATVFCGAFISVFCAVPVVFVIMMFKRLFH